MTRPSASRWPSMTPSVAPAGPVRLWPRKERAAFDRNFGPLQKNRGDQSVSTTERIVIPFVRTETQSYGESHSSRRSAARSSGVQLMGPSHQRDALSSGCPPAIALPVRCSDRSRRVRRNKGRASRPSYRYVKKFRPRCCLRLCSVPISSRAVCRLRSPGSVEAQSLSGV